MKRGSDHLPPRWLSARWLWATEAVDEWWRAWLCVGCCLTHFNKGRDGTVGPTSQTRFGPRLALSREAPSSPWWWQRRLQGLVWPTNMWCM